MPAQVITYRNDATHAYCQLKLESGERVLIPQGSGYIGIFKLILGGTIPFGIVWKIDSSEKLEPFMQSDEAFNMKPLDVIVSAVREYPSIRAMKEGLQKQERG